MKALAGFMDFLKDSGLQIKNSFHTTIIDHLSKISNDYK